MEARPAAVARVWATERAREDRLAVTQPLEEQMVPRKCVLGVRAVLLASGRERHARATALHQGGTDRPLQPCDLPAYPRLREPEVARGARDAAPPHGSEKGLDARGMVRVRGGAGARRSMPMRHRS